MFWVIHLTGTNGDIMMWACNDMDHVDAYVKLSSLHHTDYAVIKGERIKNFEKVCGSCNDR
jgi:hypothetical protein